MVSLSRLTTKCRIGLSVMSVVGPTRKYSVRAHIVRFALGSGLKSDMAEGPKRASWRHCRVLSRCYGRDRQEAEDPPQHQHKHAPGIQRDRHSSTRSVSD